jgi:hypothetical protein
VSGGIPNQVSSVRRVAQVPHEGAPVVDGALPDVAKSLRLGGGGDQATRLGQGHDTDEAGKPGHWRHMNWSTERIQTAIPPLQQVRLAGAGRATLSWRHISSAGMTQGFGVTARIVRPAPRIRASRTRVIGSQLDDADQEEDHEHDDDYADDSDSTASVVHFDLPFSNQ